MIAKASARFVRISPRKVRYVIDLIRKKPVPQAQGILNGSPRRATEMIKKLLNQALDAAEKNARVNARDLVISKILADGGPTMKRFRAASMGRASTILKRTSHIYLELDLARPGVVSTETGTRDLQKKTQIKPEPSLETGRKTPLKKPVKKLVGAK